MRYPRSAALFDRAQRSIPGGHHLSGRPLLDPNRSPLYFDRAKGCRLWDVDGHEYIDYLMAYGAFVLGYGEESVDRAAFAQTARGHLVSLNHPLHVEFIETLLERFPFAEMGAFFKTGSEATTAAVRIARRATGRRKIIRCGYHGWHDWCVPAEDFVPAGLTSQVLECRPSDPVSMAALFAENPGEIAAVILAPEMVPEAQAAVIVRLLDLARHHGSVFILDEIKTAFRTPPGSIHQRIGIQPDILTVSKALGNGWPVAATLGTRAVMENARGMHLSATYHGDTAAMAAALKTLELLDEQDVAEHLWRMGERLLSGLKERAQRHRLPVAVYGEPLPPMPFMRFDHEVATTNDAMQATFYEEVFRRGVLLHPRHLWFVSAAHGEEDIDRTLDACDGAFERVRKQQGDG
ncbi:MAG: aminotransferase class III-fold pyridoxal phosphate-dependent enzyme [Myxococcota bacterium]|nr:aminotransferase class III-fold pyridoxal phosphate-dependent enzyme [Myxococcota bacterium]